MDRSIEFIIDFIFSGSKNEIYNSNKDASIYQSQVNQLNENNQNQEQLAKYVSNKMARELTPSTQNLYANFPSNYNNGQSQQQYYAPHQTQPQQYHHQTQQNQYPQHGQYPQSNQFNNQYMQQPNQYSPAQSTGYLPNTPQIPNGMDFAGGPSNQGPKQKRNKPKFVFEKSNEETNESKKNSKS